MYACPYLCYCLLFVSNNWQPYVLLYIPVSFLQRVLQSCCQKRKCDHSLHSKWVPTCTVFRRAEGTTTEPAGDPCRRLPVPFSSHRPTTKTSGWTNECSHPSTGSCSPCRRIWPSGSIRQSVSAFFCFCWRRGVFQFLLGNYIRLEFGEEISLPHRRLQLIEILFNQDFLLGKRSGY